jgi:glutathione-regulated potassium-efflux system ancillary protein KefC/glutathione-regulated potassium-efflux system protein KefB
MTIDFGLLASRPAMVALLVGGFLAVKIATLWLVARAAGINIRERWLFSFLLSQAGEFGFVVFASARDVGVVSREWEALFTVAIALSMALTPLLLIAHDRVICRRARREREPDTIDTSGPVIIAGFGRFGQIVGRVLRMRRISFTALEGSVAQIDVLRRFGNKVYYGDASRLEVLQAAGAARAEVFVLALDDVDASVRTAELVRRHFPNLKIMARARNRQHAVRLMDIGVRYFIRETYLSSLDLAQHTLEALGLTRADAIESIRRFDVHDKKQLQIQREFRDDEQKLIQSAQLAARELEQLFESDAEPSGEEQQRRAEVAN